MKKLHDGREVADDSQEWRDECLARWVLGMSSIEAADDWVKGFGQKNGAAAESELRARVNALRNVRRLEREATKRGTLSPAAAPVSTRTAKK